MKTFMGYERPDGSVGVRNHILVMATMECSWEPAKKIAGLVEGTVVVGHSYGCRAEENSQVINNLVAIGQHPNVAAVLVVGLGCEHLTADLLADGISKSGKPVEAVVIQEVGGSLKAIEHGAELARRMAAEAGRAQRRQFDAKELVVAVKCGGSDATSGLAANPAVGAAMDAILEAGGTVIMTEVHEMIGTEHLLAKRAASEEIAQKLRKAILDEEKRKEALGLISETRYMARGNIEGGLTTIEEKALGGITKGGTKPIVGFLENNAHRFEKPKGKGFYIQEGTHIDVPCVTHMVAAGAQLVVFTTGRGSTVGHAIAPVIKVTGNPITYERMKDDMDINAGTVITGEESIEAVGRRIFDEVLEVASGKRTKSEALGYREFAIYKLDQRIDRTLGCGFGP